MSNLLLVNSYGPYVHGVWRSSKGVIGNEESLDGRAETIVETYISKLKSRFSEQELATMTICDIGCYDGWILHEIEKRIKFKSLCGYEPRAKNIERGQVVREYLGINTNIIFKKGSLGDVYNSGNRYDIVLLSGVIHHLEKLPEAIEQLTKICKVALLIEGNSFEDNESLAKIFGRKFKSTIEDIINPKDIVYSDQMNTLLKTGLAGYKLESSYYDGSTIGEEIQVVTIASPEYLKMLLYAKGAEEIEVLKSPQEYKKSMEKKAKAGRNRYYNYRFTSIYERISEKEKELEINPAKASHQLYEDTENRYLKTYLPKGYLNMLEANQAKFLGWRTLIQASVHGNNLANKLLKANACKKYKLTEEQKSIINTFHHCPRNKLRLEQLKIHILNSQWDKSKEILYSILYDKQADWRCVYRSLALSLFIGSEIKSPDGPINTVELLKKSNPNFPESIINTIKACKRPSEFF